MKNFIGLINIILIFLACSEVKIKWVKKFDMAGPGNYQINGLFVFHNIWTTGTYWEKEKNPHCITAEYNEKGELEWYKIYERQNLKSSEGKAMIGNQDAIYILAQTVDINNIKDATLIKYNELGSLQWEKIVEKSLGEISGELFSDNSGNLFIVGSATNAKDSISIFVAKYRPSGELVWSTKYNNASLLFRNLKFDLLQSNQLVIGGILEENKNFFFLRCDSLGKFSDLTKYENADSESNLADIKIDEKDNVYLTGASFSKETGNDYLTIAYDKNNNLFWAKRLDGKTHQEDMPKAMAVDESSNIYVTGSSKNAHGETEILTIAYDKNGNELWTKICNNGKDKSAEPIFLHPGFLRLGKDVISNLYIIGTVDNAVILLKYNITGGDSWVETYYGNKGKKYIPTAFSGLCITVQAISENAAEAVIIKYEKAEPIGFARWD